MGGKTSTQTTTLPPPSPEEKEATAQFNAILQAQMERNGYVKNEEKTFVFKRQAEIDEIDRQIAQLTSQQSQTQSSTTSGGGLYSLYGGLRQPGGSASDIQGQLQALQNQKNDLMQEGGEEKINVSYTETPEAKARRLQNQAEQDAIETQFFGTVKKLLSGDFSTTPEQQAQIKKIVGDNFDPVMNMITAEFSSAEDKVNEAVGKLIESGKADIYQEYLTQKNELNNQLRLQENGLRNSAAALGRSYTDTDFQRATAEAGQEGQRRLGEYQIAALESLGKSGAATAANAIAGLRGQRAGLLSQTASQAAGAGLNLTMLAANPLASFGAGGNYLQLNNALNQQGMQNLLASGGLLQGSIGQMQGLRQAQPTTSTTKPFGILDVLGTLGGLAGTAASAYGAFA